MARRKIGRDISGVLLLDKPIGVTSNKILQQIKTIFFAKKAGHTGSLDPLATGLLPICFGEATKFSHYLLNADKKYLVECQLGVTTDSADADGEILAIKPVAKLSPATIKKQLQTFLGISQQLPPMHSAIKINGEPLYKKARRGETVIREKREINIFQFDFVNLENDKLTLAVHCSKGTYVRTLVEDLGKKLGCGAHICQLRRTMVGAFAEHEMITMQELETKFVAKDFMGLNNLLIPTYEMVRELPRVDLNRDQKYYVQQGQALRINNGIKSGKLSLFFEDKFLGVATILEDGRIQPKRLVM